MGAEIDRLLERIATPAQETAAFERRCPCPRRAVRPRTRGSDRFAMIDNYASRTARV